jgi:hypothetical protein
MPLPRFRTTFLMAAVATMGVAIAAVRNASRAWAAGLFTATLLMFAADLLSAIGRAPPDLRRRGLVVYSARRLKQRQRLDHALNDSPS